MAKIGKTADASVMTAIEAAKVHCADVHFKALSGGGVRYVVADSCESLLKKMMMQERLGNIFNFFDKRIEMVQMKVYR